jgi:branched-chain amino acid transport system permease protein
MKIKENHFDDIRYFDQGYKRVIFALFLIFLLLLPLFIGRYAIYIANLMAIYIIVAVGLNLLTGTTGQISIGHSAFLAIGAYSSALLTSKIGIPFLIALPLSGLITAIAGIIVGIPALRIGGFYLAIATMSFAFIIDELIVQMHTLTRGSAGLPVVPPQIGPILFKSDTSKYYLIVPISVMMVSGAKNLMRTRIGRAFIAIRESEIAAQTMGIHLAKYKVISFAVSAFYAGIGGSLFAHLVTFINPGHFTLMESITFLTMIVVGGLGSILGSIIGAIFITILPELIRLAKDLLPHQLRVQEGLQAFVYGWILIIFILFEPQGLYGRWLKIKAYWQSWPLGRKIRRKKLVFARSYR